MGRDIHIILERKTSAGWEFFDPGFDAFDHRYYPFFSFIKSISAPGCPDELVGKKLRPIFDVQIEHRKIIHYVWNTTKKDYLYDFGYVTLGKLSEGIARYNSLWVSSDFLEQFLLLGGTLPESMRVAEETFDTRSNAIAVRVIEEDDIYLRDYVNKGVQELKQIASDHQLQHDELRLCFAFDW